MDSKIDLDKHLRRCITIITTCILLIICALASIAAFVTFIGEEGPNVREIHIQQHNEEGAKLDSMISVLERISLKLDGDDE